jgi:hypothetical protein
LIEKVLVNGVEASYFLNSDELITIRIPVGVSAGAVTISLVGTFGTVIASNLIVVSSGITPSNTKVTIGTFLGFAAVYTKNYEGHRLSMKVGTKWRVIPSLASNYTYNLTKVGKNKTVTVMVYLDRELVSVQQVKVK